MTPAGTVALLVRRWWPAMLMAAAVWAACGAGLWYLWTLRP